MVVAVDGMVTDARTGQSANARSPILMPSPAARVATLCILPYLTALTLLFVAVSLTTTSFRALQPENAPLPISFSVRGSVTVSTSSTSLNASFAMLVTVYVAPSTSMDAGMTTLPSSTNFAVSTVASFVSVSTVISRGSIGRIVPNPLHGAVV